MKPLILTAWVLPCLALAVHAQPYAIDWYKIAGGGGSSTGGVYLVSGTIGQADAGFMSGGNYALAGGFWSIIGIIPTAGAPQLTITRTTTNAVVISWPSPSAGYNLQQTTNMGAPNWVTAPQTPTDDGTTKQVVVRPPAGNLFYRLKK